MLLFTDILQAFFSPLLSAARLNIHRPLALITTGVPALIADGKLTIKQIIGLDSDGLLTLQAEGIPALIADGKLTSAQFIGMDTYPLLTLRTKGVPALIANATFTIEEIIGLHVDGHTNLQHKGICGLIADGTLTPTQAIRLQCYQRNSLGYEVIRDLIANGTLTVEQVMALSDAEHRALNDEHTRLRLRNGELTIQNIMGGQIPQGGQAHRAPININDEQRRHTASVHRTVSDSATRLLNRYVIIMDPRVLEEILTKIKKSINSLPYGKLVNSAAKRCIARLAASTYVYTDPASGVTIRQLLALIGLAIYDDTMRIGRLEDARHQFIEGLYEIQRGYNLSQTGVDHCGDSPICPAGTFNKLLEKLKGVHPDVVIEVITPKLATLKLPIVVDDAGKYTELGELHSFQKEVSESYQRPFQTQRQDADFGPSGTATNRANASE